MAEKEITFAGAAETVTGSRYLLHLAGRRVLVDCGLFQGVKSLRERNWAAPPFEARSLDAVVLTHAHIDHSGFLPRLQKSGFNGPVFCTQGTRDLLQILLPDSGFLQEEQARHANEHDYSRHRPALPLYTRAEAERALTLLRPVDFREVFEPCTGVRGQFSRAGHIIGAASVLLEADGTRIAFSGDVGRDTDLLMRPPEPLLSADYLVVESTYGERRHPAEDVHATIEKVICDTVDRRGSVVVPAFAVGRAQHLLYILSGLRKAQRIPDVPVFLDSPMAISATEIFQRHPADHRLSARECAEHFEFARYVHTPDESRAVDADSAPKIIVSASGMATGGRVLHHLRRFLPDERSTVLLVGYQAAGTRGRALLEGADELKIHGQYVRVRARIAQAEGLSAHADYAEMLEWLKKSQLAPRRVFVTHGEPGPADAMRRRLRDTFGWEAVVPSQGQRFSL